MCRRAVSGRGAFNGQRRPRSWVSIEFGLHPRERTRNKGENEAQESMDRKPSRSRFNTFV